jgi:hypothetical protein
MGDEDTGGMRLPATGATHTVYARKMWPQYAVEKGLQYAEKWAQIVILV